MDALVTFAKENFQLIILFVGLTGVAVSCVALVHELKLRKRKNEKIRKTYEHQATHSPKS